jgi:hypothetical protein
MHNQYVYILVVHIMFRGESPEGKEMSGSIGAEAPKEMGTEVPEDLPAVFAYLQARAENIANASDKLRAAMKSADWALSEDINKNPGVGRLAGVESDSVRLPDDYCLKIAWSRGKKAWFLFWIGDPESGYAEPREAHEISREALKAAVKELPAFLAAYAQKLADEEVELGGFAEKAERIAEILAPAEG